jgi:peptidoglycan/LPS O-acetylase OafA/YrhL
MKQQSILKSVIMGIGFSLVMLFFDLKWHTALINKQEVFNFIYFFSTTFAFLGMAFAHGFRFRFLKERIKRKRINLVGIVGYIFLIYLLLKENSLSLVFSVSKVMGVLYLLFLVLIVLAPLYMESEKDKSDKVA